MSIKFPVMRCDRGPLALAAPAVLVVLAMSLLLAPGRSEAAMPGPNGKIAFVSARTGTDQIFSMNPDGSGVTQLTTFGGGALQDPTWSPDGTRIAFTRFGGCLNCADIHVMDADGSGLISIGGGGDRNDGPAWSPDGSKIAYRRTDYATGKSNIYVMDASGATIVPNTVGGAQPAWSPDGARIAYTASSSVYVVNVDGSGLRKLADGWYPDWSPDGSTIAIQGTKGNSLVRADGSALRSLGVVGSSLAWAPDGKQIAYARDGELFIANADGTGETLLTRGVGVFFGGARALAWQRPVTMLLREEGNLVVHPMGARPYPAPLQLKGYDGRIADVKVTLQGVTHARPADLDVVLVGPGGQAVTLLSDAGGTTTTVNNVDLRFSDSAPAPLSETQPLQSGTWFATNYQSYDGMPAPCCSGWAPYGTTLSAFKGTDPNGVWNLYVADDQRSAEGWIASWDLQVTTRIDAPARVRDGLSADEDFHTSTAALWGASWDAVADAKGYEYAVGTTPGGTDVRGWTDSAGKTYVHSTGITPVEGKTYYYSVRAYTGNLRSAVTTSNGIMVDTRAPGSAVDRPGTAFVRSLASVAGTATDPAPGSGVGEVRVSLQRDTDGLNWTGSYWAAGPIWLRATANANWSWTPPLLADGKYTVFSQARDRAGNGETPGPRATFVLDTRAPGSTVTEPAAGARVSSVSQLQGIASDVTSGVDKVEVSLQRNADSLYWDGSGWVATERWLPATGTATWALTAPALADGGYTVRSRATDRSGNVETPSAGSGFILDTTPPKITDVAVTPAYFSPDHDGTRDTTELSFTLSEPARRVSVAIFDTSGALIHVIETTGVQGSNTATWNGDGIHGEVEGAYTFTVEAEDRAGNGGAPQTGPQVVIDMTRPEVSLTGVDSCCNQAQPTGIGAEALDDGAGIDGVRFRYKLATDTFYADLNWDAAAPYDLDWGAIRLQEGTDYDFVAVAVDDAGNRRTSGATRVTVDLTPPAISRLQVTPEPFSPKQDGSATFDYELSEPASVRIRIHASDSGPGFHELGPFDQAAGLRSETWDGRDDDGSLFRAGTYEYEIMAADTHGNTASRHGAITVR